MTTDSFEIIAAEILEASTEHTQIIIFQRPITWPNMDEFSWGWQKAHP